MVHKKRRRNGHHIQVVYLGHKRSALLGLLLQLQGFLAYCKFFEERKNSTNFTIFGDKYYKTSKLGDFSTNVVNHSY